MYLGFALPRPIVRPKNVRIVRQSDPTECLRDLHLAQGGAEDLELLDGAAYQVGKAVDAF